MSIQKPNFEDYVHHPQNDVNNFFESYFYLEGISGKLGGRVFDVIDANKGYVKIRNQSKSVTAEDVIKNIIKIFSYFTIIIPIAMGIGKKIIRQHHEYSILDVKSNGKGELPIKDIEKAKQNWIRGLVNKPESLKVSGADQIDKSEVQLTIENKKQMVSDNVTNILKIVNDLKKGLALKTDQKVLNSNVGILSDVKKNGIRITKGSLTVGGKQQIFEATYSEKYKMTTWKMEFDGQRYEINEYEPGAYNGPKTENFIERQRVLINAAKRYANNLPIKDVEKNERAKEKINALLSDIEEDFISQLSQKENNIDPYIISNEDQKIADRHYNEVYAQAEKLLAQMARDIQFVVHAVSKEADENCEKFDSARLAQTEKDYIVARGRPTILNTYFIKGPHRQIKQYFSTQTPASTINEKGEKAPTRMLHVEGNRRPRPMLPSSIRDREGLVNYVETAFGVLSEENGKIKAVTKSIAIRHSSYSPITIKDPYKRSAMACRNCKQNLTDLAASMLQTHPDVQTSVESPLVIPLRTMMLLTPKQNIDFFRNHKKFIAGQWTGESETLQLEESALALKIYNQRVIKVKIDGKDVWIKPDISFMNLGTNKLAMKEGFFGALDPPSSMLAYNAKGFVDFENEVFNFVKNQLPPNRKLKNLVDEMTLFDKDPRLLKASQALEIIKSKNIPQIKILYARLERLLEENLESPVRNKNSQDRLDRFIEEDLDLTARNKDLLDKINSVRKEIDDLEAPIYAHYRTFFSIKSELFKAKDIQNLFQKLRAELNKTPSEQPEKKKELNGILLKFEQATTAYYTKAYKEADSIMDFQSLYLDINEKMHHFIEFFCKSAEDRTGRLDDERQEDGVFEDLTGQIPLSLRDREYINSHISPYINEFGVSQSNTEQNSGARGKQISTEIFKHLAAKPFKKSAKLAKKIITKSKKLKPSPWVKKKIAAMAF